MTPTLPLLGHDTLVISITQLEKIKTCARMWLYNYLYRRVRASVSPAAQGGKAFDAALNYRYQTLGNAPCTPEVEAEMLRIIDAAYEGVELPLDEYRTAARYKEVVQAYNEHWQGEPFEVLGVQVPFAVELGSVEVPSQFWWRRGEVPFTGEVTCFDGNVEGRWDARRIRVILHGILDLFVRLNNHVMIVDTKTSKSGKEGAYENSSQMKGYSWALPELARTNPDAGLPERVHGCFINEVVIREPYRNPAYAQRATTKARNEFKRTLPAFYTPERLEEWRQDTLLHVEQALGWVARNHFPQSEKHCSFYYGSKCPYIGVCSLPAEQRHLALASDEFMDYERGPLGELNDASEPA